VTFVFFFSRRELTDVEYPCGTFISNFVLPMQAESPMAVNSCPFRVTNLLVCEEAGAESGSTHKFRPPKSYEKENRKGQAVEEHLLSSIELESHIQMAQVAPKPPSVLS
jgi:hypothetical protein